MLDTLQNCHWALSRGKAILDVDAAAARTKLLAAVMSSGWPASTMRLTFQKINTPKRSIGAANVLTAFNTQLQPRRAPASVAELGLPPTQCAMLADRFVHRVLAGNRPRFQPFGEP